MDFFYQCTYITSIEREQKKLEKGGQKYNLKAKKIIFTKKLSMQKKLSSLMWTKFREEWTKL